MKKFGFLLMACVSLFLMSCGGSSETPGDVAKKAFQNFASDNCQEVLLEGVEVTDEDRKMVDFLCGLLKESIDEKGGITNIEVLNETIAEDGQTAKVTLNVTYGNGSIEEETTSLTLSENGKWKCVFGLN